MMNGVLTRRILQAAIFPFGALLLTSFASAQQNTIENFDVTQSGSQVLVRVALKNPLAGAPVAYDDVYTTDSQEKFLIHQAEALELLESQGLVGRGLGWIDVHLLASARLARIGVWTLDRRLQAAARGLGVLADPG